MQATIAFRKSSINSIVATFAVVLALTAGVLGGYWLKSQVGANLAPTAHAAAGNASVAQPRILDGWERDLTSTSAAIPDAVERAMSKMSSLHVASGGTALRDDSHLFIATGPADYMTQHEDSRLILGEAGQAQASR